MISTGEKPTKPKTAKHDIIVISKCSRWTFWFDNLVQHVNLTLSILLLLNVNMPGFFVIIIKEHMITSSVSKIAYVMAEITFKVVMVTFQWPRSLL